MRIAVTGKTGQVACSLSERGSAAGHELVLVGRPDLDLTAPEEHIIRVLEALKPDAIVSAAAYTIVDKAESEPNLAFRINEHGARAVATAAAALDVPLLHLSTDYVFDGRKSESYIESDNTAPTNVYGASKLAGERAVAAVYPNSAILRTAWVYSPFGSNFVKTMLQLAGDHKEIRVVADQVGNPTNALDIADAVLAIAANLTSSSDPEARGTFHLTAPGDASWADFAEEIFAIARTRGNPSAIVERISTAEYPTPARRPANSRLNSSRIASAHHVRLPDWRQSLRSVVARLKSAS